MQADLVERAPYGRTQEITSRNGNAQTVQGYRRETYYNQPVLNPPHYQQLVASYLFMGGLAGASQLIATITDLCGRRKYESMVRAGRYLALSGAVTGPAFLIADLHTPERWYNMLRIFRPTSPMSIGSWTLADFGTLSAITAGLQFVADRFGRSSYRRAARTVSIPAAAAGAVVATYTGTLLAATSSPLWASASRLLPALFGISATATATAALSLSAHAQSAPASTIRRLNTLGLITAAAELFVGSRLNAKWEREKVAEPLHQEPLATAYSGYKGLAIAAPLISYGVSSITGKTTRRRAIAVSIATLAGGYLLRSVLLAGGRESAKRPQDYFQFTQSS